MNVFKICIKLCLIGFVLVFFNCINDGVVKRIKDLYFYSVSVIGIRLIL